MATTPTPLTVTSLQASHPSWLLLSGRAAGGKTMQCSSERAESEPGAMQCSSGEWGKGWGGVGGPGPMGIWFSGGRGGAV